MCLDIIEKTVQCETIHTGTVVLVGSTHMDKQIIYDPIYELTGP